MSVNDRDKDGELNSVEGRLGEIAKESNIKFNEYILSDSDKAALVSALMLAHWIRNNLK